MPRMRGRLYSSWASSTWSLPSAETACCAKMSRISCVRSTTRVSSASSRRRCCAGASSSSTTSTSAPAAANADFSSSSLPLPTYVRGIGSRPVLHELADRVDAGGPRELVELCQLRGLVGRAEARDGEPALGLRAGQRIGLMVRHDDIMRASVNHASVAGMALSPVLAEQSTYPFVRLERAKQEAAARGVEIIDFGQGDPREPTDPLIRRALADGLAETMGYPKAEGLPELRSAIAGWVGRRFGVALDPDCELIPTLGSKEAIFSFAQVFVDVAGGRDIVLVPDPAYPVYERGAEFAGATHRAPAAPRGERLPPRPRRRSRRRRSTGRRSSGSTTRTTRPQPSRRARSTRSWRSSRRGTTSSSARTRRTASSGSTSRPPRRSSSTTARTPSSSTR